MTLGHPSPVTRAGIPEKFRRRVVPLIPSIPSILPPSTYVRAGDRFSFILCMSARPGVRVAASANVTGSMVPLLTRPAALACASPFLTYCIFAASAGSHMYHFLISNF